MHYVRELIGARELFANLTMREIRGKYSRTVFGQLWSLVNPLALMLIYTFVFYFIFRITPEPGDPSGLNIFAVWLLCGLLPWTFFANVVNLGSGSLVSNAGLIQKVYFTRIVLPISRVGAAGYTWLFEMLVLVIVLTIVGGWVLPWIPLVLVAMLLLAMFAAGIALMVAIANVYFRDTEHFLSILLQLWMYLTPIIYPITLVERESAARGGLFGTPITILGIYKLNPMEHFITVFRNLLYDNRFPDPIEWLICACWAVGALALGTLVFRRNERRLAEVL